MSVLGEYTVVHETNNYIILTKNNISLFGLDVIQRVDKIEQETGATFLGMMPSDRKGGRGVWIVNTGMMFRKSDKNGFEDLKREK